MTSEKTAPAFRLAINKRRTKVTSADRAFRDAERLMSGGEFARAIEAFRHAIGIGADDSRCLHRIAEAFRQMRQWEDALDTAELFALLGPGDPFRWELVLELAEQAGDRPAAEIAIRALIKLSPKHIRAHTALNKIQLRDGDIPAARRSADTLIRLDPESALHHYNKALLCQHQSDIDQAVNEFVLTICLEPEGPWADSARCFLQDLDVMQLNQITTLAFDDVVFRTRLTRDCREAVRSRGFALSPMGEQLLQEFCDNDLTRLSEPTRIAQYN